MRTPASYRGRDALRASVTSAPPRPIPRARSHSLTSRAEKVTAGRQSGAMGGDVNTPAARAWMAANGTPLWITGALRFETENALRLARFRDKLTLPELQQALGEIAADFASGILVACEIPAELH